jgi:hypothetical protein
MNFWKEEKGDHNAIGRWFRNQKKKDGGTFLKGNIWAEKLPTEWRLRLFI